MHLLLPTCSDPQPEHVTKMVALVSFVSVPENMKALLDRLDTQITEQRAAEPKH
jgi:hypothetical protein